MPLALSIICTRHLYSILLTLILTLYIPNTLCNHQVHSKTPSLILEVLSLVANKTLQSHPIFKKIVDKKVGFFVSLTKYIPSLILINRSFQSFIRQNFHSTHLLMLTYKFVSYISIQQEIFFTLIEVNLLLYFLKNSLFHQIYNEVHSLQSYFQKYYHKFLHFYIPSPLQHY